MKQKGEIKLYLFGVHLRFVELIKLLLCAFTVPILRLLLILQPSFFFWQKYSVPKACCREESFHLEYGYSK